MIEVSFVLFTLLAEGFLLSLAVILMGVIWVFKRKKRDRIAAETLVEHIKHQSRTRLEVTSSFLNEKYLLEGDALTQAVQDIDLTEKQFFQKLINIYLNRDSEGLSSLDASVAEMVDIYKSLSPKAPQSDPAENEVCDVKLEQKENKIKELQESHDKLVEELAITKETMSNMIGEFGNMFGGGQDHDLDKGDVMDKVIQQQDEETTNIQVEKEGPAESVPVQESAANPADDVEIDLDEVAVNPSTDEPKEAQVVTDEDVDDLLKSLDLSDDKT